MRGQNTQKNVPMHRFHFTSRAKGPLNPFHGLHIRNTWSIFCKIMSLLHSTSKSILVTFNTDFLGFLRSPKDSSLYYHKYWSLISRLTPTAASNGT